MAKAETLTLVPDHPDDFLYCEFCGKAGLEDMHAHGDIELCHECHAEVITEAHACDHEWRIEANEAGDIGVFCDKCGIWKARASTPVF